MSCSTVSENKGFEQGYCFRVIEIPYINSLQICSVTEKNLIHVDHKDMGTMKILV